MRIEHHLKIAEYLAHLLDHQFKIGKFRFGLDPIIGFVPGFGDAISFLLSWYFVWIAIHMKLPIHKISHMIGNIVFDFLFGIIPVLGDIADFTYKANSRNLKILKSHVQKPIIEGEVIDES